MSGVILHLGAGQCSELDAHLACEPKLIVLVEANPDVARRLERRTSKLSNVNVIPAAVSRSGGKADLMLFNLSDFSSLRTPTGLRSIFPGLRIKREIEVDVLTVSELFEYREFIAGADNRLVIDTPGEEYSVLESMQTSGLLECFDTIDLRCSKNPLFEDSVDADSIIFYLNELGYEIIKVKDQHDPEFLHRILRRNPLRRDIANLQKQVESQKSQLRQQSERTSELLTLINRERREKELLEKKIIEYEGQIRHLESKLKLLANQESSRNQAIEEAADVEEKIELIRDILLRDKN